MVPEVAEIFSEDPGDDGFLKYMSFGTGSGALLGVLGSASRVRRTGISMGAGTDFFLGESSRGSPDAFAASRTFLVPQVDPLELRLE